jgi:hypothetical protein
MSAATEERIADLTEAIRDLGALIGFNQAINRFDLVGNSLALRADLEGELAEVEGR